MPEFRNCILCSIYCSSESEEVVESGVEDSASSEHEEVFYLQPFDQCLTAIGETPIAKKKLQQIEYRKTEAEEVRTVVKKMVPEIK